MAAITSSAIYCHRQSEADTGIIPCSKPSFTKVPQHAGIILPFFSNHCKRSISKMFSGTGEHICKRDGYSDI